MTLSPVPGKTTRTTVELGPGTAQLGGTVVGPDGPVAGAVVHVERLVGDATATADVATGPEGTWTLAGVKGGRYRVRAWRPPDLVLLGGEVFFLAATEARVLNLVLERQAGLSVEAAIAPDPPPVGQAANLAVRVLQRAVDARGVVRTRPVPGASVQLLGHGRWTVVSANPTTTDAEGSARWQLRCEAAGPQPLTAAVMGSAVAATVPPCAS